MSTFLVIHVGIVHMEGGMSISKLACLLVLANLLGAPSAWAQQRLTGIWLTEDKSSHVAFQPCGGEDCGQIVWLREPTDPETGKPWRDKFNPDDALKRRPLLGLAMLTSLKPSGDGQWNGDLYNPLDGMTYTGRLQNLGPDRLQLKGCALAGLLCQTETWTRVVP
jgi:uncharacterized protein (DUF2147 family)